MQSGGPPLLSGFFLISSRIAVYLYHKYNEKKIIHSSIGDPSGNSISLATILKDRTKYKYKKRHGIVHYYHLFSIKEESALRNFSPKREKPLPLCKFLSSRRRIRNSGITLSSFPGSNWTHSNQSSKSNNTSYEKKHTQIPR